MLTDRRWTQMDARLSARKRVHRRTAPYCVRDGPADTDAGILPRPHEDSRRQCSRLGAWPCTASSPNNNQYRRPRSTLVRSSKRFRTETLRARQKYYLRVPWGSQLCHVCPKVNATPTEILRRCMKRHRRGKKNDVVCR